MLQVLIYMLIRDVREEIEAKTALLVSYGRLQNRDHLLRTMQRVWKLESEQDMLGFSFN